MRILVLLSYYFLLIIGQSGLVSNYLSENHHSLKNLTKTTASFEHLKLTCSCPKDSKNKSTNSENTQHHCPVCHAHTLFLHNTFNSTIFHIASITRLQLTFFDQNHYSPSPLNSIFRPPIA